MHPRNKAEFLISEKSVYSAYKFDEFQLEVSFS